MIQFFVFQSTPLCEGRQASHEASVLPLYFNPLPSARGDCDEGKHQGARRISIHSPLRGETGSTSVTPRSANFNPLPSARGDSGAFEPISICSNFNPLPSARGDYMDDFYFICETFQSTPLCEGRQLPMECRTEIPNFNPPPSARGD